MNSHKSESIKLLRLRTSEASGLYGSIRLVKLVSTKPARAHNLSSEAKISKKHKYKTSTKIRDFHTPQIQKYRMFPYFSTAASAAIPNWPVATLSLLLA